MSLSTYALAAAAAAAMALSPMTSMAASSSNANNNSSKTAKTAAQSNMKSPPPAPYKAVSSLVKLPDFLPGMGQLFVNPATLPAGPFLAYDHDGKLVSTIYMVPLSAMKAGMNLNNLAVGTNKVDHVDMVFNAGHPGVEEPHVHIVLWHVNADQESRVAK